MFNIDTIFLHGCLGAFLLEIWRLFCLKEKSKYYFSFSYFLFSILFILFVGAIVQVIEPTMKWAAFGFGLITTILLNTILKYIANSQEKMENKLTEIEGESNQLHNRCTEEERKNKQLRKELNELKIHYDEKVQQNYQLMDEIKKLSPQNKNDLKNKKTKDIPKDIPEDILKDIPKDIPEDILKYRPKDIPEDILKDILKYRPEYSYTDVNYPSSDGKRDNAMLVSGTSDASYHSSYHSNYNSGYHPYHSYHSSGSGSYINFDDILKLICAIPKSIISFISSILKFIYAIPKGIISFISSVPKFIEKCISGIYSTIITFYSELRCRFPKLKEDFNNFIRWL